MRREQPSRSRRVTWACVAARRPLVVVRSRFHFREHGPVDGLVAVLDRIARRGSHGVIVKAPDVVDVHDAVARLTARGIPVVTLVTDLPFSERVPYVGMDNHAAGETAAYLITQWLGASVGDVLVTLSSESFRGEEERLAGFHDAMRSMQPERCVAEIAESGGLDVPTRELVLDALAGHAAVCAVYSIGGGNRAILDAFDKLGRSCMAFVAHDLDRDNRLLLSARRISAVLHHDLSQDMRRACHLIMRWHKALPGAIGFVPANIQVITPHNMPATSVRP